MITGNRSTEQEAVDPAHIGTAGKGIKSGDDEALPIKHSFHDWMHRDGEITVFRKHAHDWLLRAALRAYAREMYREWKEE